VSIKEIIPKGLDLKDGESKISINGKEITNTLVKKEESDGSKNITAGLTNISRK
jgi:hypothetical protein